MASPGAETAIPIALISGSFAAYFSYDPTFWVVVVVAAIYKMRNTAPVLDAEGNPFTGGQRYRQLFIMFLSAVAPAFFFTKIFAEAIGIETIAIELVLAIGLVFIFEGLARWSIRKANNPDSLIEMVLKAWRGGGGK